MYNDEFDRFHNGDQYHYGRNSNLPADDYQPAGRTPDPEEPKPARKSGFFHSAAAKVVAIVRPAPSSAPAAASAARRCTAMPAARTPSFSSPAASLSPSR